MEVLMRRQSSRNQVLGQSERVNDYESRRRYEANLKICKSSELL